MSVDSSIERWAPIVGFEKRYEVSTLGRVRGIGPRCCGVRVPYVNDGGYHQYGLYAGFKNGRDLMRQALAHQLVAAAFIGTRPAGMLACHNDGDGGNNALTNIRYDTRLGNAADMIKHGRSLPGEKNHQAKLTDAKVRKIRRDKDTYRVIAARYSVSFATIQKVKSGAGWCHVR